MTLDQSLQRLLTATLFLFVFGLILFAGQYEGTGQAAERPLPAVEVRATGAPSPALIPRILAVTPPSRIEGHMSFDIQGADFSPGASAYIGGTKLTVDQVSSTLIQADLPTLPPGQYSVTVVNMDGAFGTFANALTIE